MPDINDDAELHARFDSDYRLVGKCRNKLDLLVPKGLNRLAAEAEYADRLPFA